MNLPSLYFPMICWHEKHILLELLEQMDVMRLHVTVVAFIAFLP